MSVTNTRKGNSMFIRYNTNTGSMGVYATKKEAGTDMPVYGSSEELATTKASLTELARFYNQLTGKDIKKFSDKESAVKRVWDAAVAAHETYNEQSDGAINEQATYDKPAEEKQQEMFSEEKPTPDEDKAQDEPQQSDEGNSQPEGESQPVAVPVAEKGKRGRKPGTGQFAGKTIFAKKQVNPRRAGTKGWHSYELFREKADGMPYADYIAAGGRAVDLDWDIKHKFAEVK